MKMAFVNFVMKLKQSNIIYWCVRNMYERAKGCFSRLKIKDKSLKNLLGNEDHLHTLLAFIKATGRYQSS